MHIAFKASLLSVLAVLALQGCAPLVIGTGATVGLSATDRRSVGTQADDEVAEWRARALVHERYAGQLDVQFTSFNRDILITGQSKDPVLRANIERAVRALPGVRHVYNEITLHPLSTPTSRMNDSAITSNIKARLLYRDKTLFPHVKVVVERNTAYLMGLVSDKEAKIAIDVARNSRGVKNVVVFLDRTLDRS